MQFPKWMVTLNPVDGCDFGCEYCYARKMNQRFKWIEDWNNPQFFPERIKFNTRSPKFFFLDSMSDFAAWCSEWQEKVILEARRHPQNRYMTLTKRPELYINHNMPNIWWYGVTVTCAADKDRIKVMKKNVKGCHYHVCFEPVLGPIGEVDLDNVEWIEIGAETGNRKGKVKPKKEWLMEIIEQARAKNIPIMMKESIRNIVGNENFEFRFPFSFD